MLGRSHHVRTFTSSSIVGENSRSAGRLDGCRGEKGTDKARAGAAARFEASTKAYRGTQP